MSRGDLGRFAQCSSVSVTRTIDNFTSPNSRQVVPLKSGNFRLTDLGAKRIRDELAEKLLAQ